MKRAGGIALVVILLAASFSLGLLLTRSPGLLASPAPGEPRARERPPRVIDEVRHELQTGYYRSVESDVLGAQSISAILDALDDPNTDHLTAAEYETLKRRTARSYAGVGLTVEPTRAGLVVTSALPGPAREAGIRPGDVIVRIDGKRADSLSFDQSLALIKGERGTLVELVVRRPAKGRIKYTVVRQEIALPFLRAKLLRAGGKKIGYVRLLSFPDSAAARLEESTRKLVDRGVEGLVLDLRDNPGGLLSQSVRTVSLFLDEGIVCTTWGLHQEMTTYQVSGNASHPNLPLVVLVNQGSASAAEIVAAALSEQERALLVGRHTFGKASVQSIRPLSNGTALKLTTATYLTPQGVDLARRGVVPEVRAFDDPLTRPDEALRVAKRALVQELEQTG